MQYLKSAYKFTYKKPENRKNLPNRSYIRQREDEEYFFYRLEANNYISLDVLLKLYHSQILRLSIGQWILLINMIYKKIIQIYLNGNQLSGNQIGILTFENIWIYTKQGFNGELNPQNYWQIIFLNYHDEFHVKYETNINKFSSIQDHIIKVCKDTEFKIRAKLGDNNLFINQFIDILDDLFYDFQQLLYTNIDQVDNFIKEHINELQEIEYEYNNEDTIYIRENFSAVVEYLNQIYQLQDNSQSEFDQHKVLLKWQEGLYNCIIESHWNRAGYQMTMELLDFIKKQISDNKQLSNFGKKELENKIFKKMEDYGFFNFNSQTVRFSKIYEIKKQIKSDLVQEEDNHERTYELKGQLYLKYEKMAEGARYHKAQDQEFMKLLNENEDLILNYYQTTCQNQWALYTKFYFTIDLYKKWYNYLVDNLTKDITEQKELKKLLDEWFKNQLRLNQISEENEEKFQNHD